MREIRSACRIVNEGKKLFELEIHKFGNNFKIDLNKILWESADWVHFVQDRDR
jgi:hypothetical protein